jgi:hypothetical protein
VAALLATAFAEELVKGTRRGSEAWAVMATTGVF